MIWSLHSWLLAVTVCLHISSVTAAEESCDYDYIAQHIDHFGLDNGTFQQRFSIKTEFFQPGGPILLFQGEEADILDCANSTILYEWAEQLGGLAVSLEHRYFGPSKPFGNASTTNENFKLLTLDNVMSDAVEFVNQIRTNITGAKDSRVMVASGSYGGFLAAAFRMNHPETFDVALASAGPIMGFGDASDAESYNWWNWLNRLYLDYSIEASEKIKNAFSQLQNRLVANDTGSLQDELKLCTPVIPGNLTQTGVLISLLSQPFSNAPEFNYPYPSPGRTPVALPFFEILNIAVNQTDPIQLLADVNWMLYEPLGFECIDHEHATDFLKSSVPLINYEVFSYITCTFLPLRSSAFTSKDTIFLERTVNITLANLACESKYDARPFTKAEMETRYHFAPDELQNSTHIIWSKGEYDPTSSVEPLALPLTANRDASRTLYAPDVAHREDLFRSHEKDRESTKMLRRKELEIIKGWLSPVDETYKTDNFVVFS